MFSWLHWLNWFNWLISDRFYNCLTVAKIYANQSNQSNNEN